MKVINGWVDRDQVVLIHRNEAGELRKRLFPAQFVGYYKCSELPNDVVDVMMHDERVQAVDVEGDWYRVSWHPGRYDENAWNERKNKFGKWIEFREEHAKQLETYGYRSYEADVNPLKRLLADTPPEIARPKRAYVDIEVDARKNFPEQLAGNARVLSWAVSDVNGPYASRLLAADSDDAEVELLDAFWRCIEPFDQCVFWNSPKEDPRAYDATVLRNRSRVLKCSPKDVRRWLWLDFCSAYARYNIMSAESGEMKQSFKLGNIATQELGEGKHDVDNSKTWEEWLANPQRLLAYNVQDTDLLRKLENKTGYLELFQTVCEVCGIFPDTRSLKPTAQFDAYMLRLGRQKGVHFATRWYDTPVEETKFKGAFVMEAKCKGIQRSVHCADFSSLYPSIMLTWNLSPETKLPKESNEGCLSPLTGVRTKTEPQGILCYALDELLTLRKAWNKKRAACAPGTPEAKDAERRTSAYKTVANSGYGVTGTPYSRFYDRDISESTAQNGVWLITKTIEAAEQRGMRAIYGDTDSVFVQGASRDEFAAFVQECNENLYPKLLPTLGCKENRISLAYEKEFERLVFTAGKKRYVGVYAHYKGTAATKDSKPEIKGLEYRRGDTARLARELQGRVIDLFAQGCEVLEPYYTLVLEARRRVLEEPLSLEDVVLSKSISKELGEYVVRQRADGGTSVPAHVGIAKTMLEAGQEVGIGTRIPYVVFDASVSPAIVIPASEYDGACDRFYLWEQRIYPPTQRLLEAAFPNENWRDLERARPSRTYNPKQLEMFGAMGLVR